MRKLKRGLIDRFIALYNAACYCIFPRFSIVSDRQKFTPSMLMVWGLIYGLILSAIFAVSWKYFGDIYFSERSRLRLMPSAMVLLASCLLNFKQFLGFSRTADRLADPKFRQSDIYSLALPGILAIVMIILIKFSALLAMPYHTPWWPTDWRRYFNCLYPQMHFRVLILIGLWGKMGVIIASSTGQSSADIDSTDKIIRGKSTIKSLLGNLVIVFIVTTIYFSSWRNRAIGLLVSFIIFLIVYLVSMIISWRIGGHNKYSIFACGELAEILLLLAYLSIARFM